MANTEIASGSKRPATNGNMGKRKTHCAKGHEYTPENTKWRTRNKDESTRYQVCIMCERAGRIKSKVSKRTETYVKRKLTTSDLMMSGVLGGDTMTLAEFKKYRGIAS